jgi:hypothetical protein
VPRRQQLGLFLILFAVYLALGSREPPWTDAKQIYGVAESIVHRGELSITVATGVGRDGRHYAIYPLVPSLIHVPGAALERAVASIGPEAARLVRPLAGHLAPAAVGALLCLLFLQLCLDRGVSPRVATAGALALGTTTLVMVYARSPYSEIAQAACFLGYFMWLLRLCQTPGRRQAIVLGIWIGLLVNTKALYVLAVPGGALLVALTVGRRLGWRPLLSLAGWVCAGGAPFAVMFLAYNIVRTGSPLQIGYPSGVTGTPLFAERILVGLWGLFLSPGKSLLLYAPPLFIALAAMPRVVRHGARDWGWAALLTMGPVVLLYARTTFWHGDWCWGPRYVVFAVPVLFLPAVLWADQAIRTMSSSRLAMRVQLGLAAAVLAAGLAVQILGSAFYWDHFLRIDHEARPQWLGRPNRSGATTPDKGGWCDPCIEDLYGVNWLPAFSPLEGHLWLARHVPFRHTAQQAVEDAPWRRYTSLTITINRSYPRARVDWWILDYGKSKRLAGGLIMTGMLLVLAAGITLMIWRRRPATSRAPIAAEKELPLPPAMG